MDIDELRSSQEKAGGLFTTEAQRIRQEKTGEKIARIRRVPR